jgi:hypothetical protein
MIGKEKNIPFLDVARKITFTDLALSQELCEL